VKTRFKVLVIRFRGFYARESYSKCTLYRYTAVDLNGARHGVGVLIFYGQVAREAAGGA
jgi:hypothetical protein